METLAVKYRPKTFNDMTEQENIKKILLNQIKEGIKNAYLFCGPAGCGKAQPLYSKVLTPNGFIEMGQVTVGTSVYTRTGEVANVTEVYPQGERDIYEITFSDRTTIRVADNHLNQIWIYNQNKKKREDFTLTTLELIDFMKKCRFKIRVDFPIIDFPHKDVPIDPYLLGCLIGDGSLHGNFSFSNLEPDLIEKINNLVGNYDCYLKHTGGCDYDIVRKTDSFKNFFYYKGVEYKGPYELISKLQEEGYPKFDSASIYRMAVGKSETIFKKYPDLIGKITVRENTNYNQDNKLRSLIKQLGLNVNSTEKFIPEIYLLNDIQVRTELLKGLFDTDGYTGVNGGTNFSTSSKRLSEDFAFLVRSLGNRDTINVKHPGYVSPEGVRIDCHESYAHHIKFRNDFVYCSSKKHLGRRQKRQHEPMKNIVSIQLIGKEACQCIYVDHPDHTYITDSFNPTHNTTSARIFAKFINGGNANVTELDAASHSGVDDIRKLIEESRFKPVGTKYRVFVIDECFPGHTLVRTPKGTTPIKDIREGDEIYNMCGKTTVKRVFRNSVSRDRLVCVRVNGTDIVTTLDHLFFTENGWIEAHNLKEGDVLFDYTELYHMWERVPMLSKRWQEDMFKRMYCEIQGTTDKGDLQGEESTDDESMSCMREGVSNISFSEFKDLWQEMCKYLQGAKWVEPEAKELIFYSSNNICLSSVWKEFTGENIQKSEVLFNRMCKSASKSSSTSDTQKTSYHGVCLCYMWQTILRELLWKTKDMFEGVSNGFVSDVQGGRVLRETQTTYENSQSIKEPRGYTKNEGNEGEKRNTSCVAWETWWKWSIDGTTENTSPRVAITARRMEDRICSTYKDGEVQWLPYELQTRPCLTGEDDWCGSGWQEPFVEKWVVEGCKESGFIRNTRVESVEVYKPGYNDELFKCCFSDTGNDSEFVTLYDLEVEGHNSYFANDIIVHNCHSLSNTAFQALLKTFEEPTPTSIFILCTTDPQKIPKTIISRVQQFDFTKITYSGIVDRLKFILGKENEEGKTYTYDEEALSYIAKLSEGGMRSAITLMEKTLGLGDKITMDSVVDSLGVLKYSTMFDLTDALCKMDKKKTIQIVEETHRSGFDLKLFIKNYTDFILELCKYDLFRDFEYLMIPTTYENRVRVYTREDFTFFLDLLDIMIKLGSDIKWDATPKPLIESTLILLCSEAS